MSGHAVTGIARPKPTHNGTRFVPATLDMSDNVDATELRQMGFGGLVTAPLERVIPKIKSGETHAADKHPVVDKLERFWQRHVSTVVPYASRRDHLGTLAEAVVMVTYCEC